MQPFASVEVKPVSKHQRAAMKRQRQRTDPESGGTAVSEATLIRAWRPAAGRGGGAGWDKALDQERRLAHPLHICQQAVIWTCTWQW